MKRAVLLPAVGALLGLAVLFGVLLSSACSLDMSYGKYAIVFGVSDYLEINDLDWTDEDASDMATLLTADGYSVWGGGAQLDGAATEGQLTLALSEIAAQATEDDLFLFYFSGHGGPVSANASEGESAADSDEEFIALHAAPYPADPTAPDILTDDELSAALSVLPCVKKIVIIDACNSGGVIGDSADVDGVPADYTGTIYLSLGSLDEALSAYFGPSSDSDITPGEAIVLAAAGELESSYEDLADGSLGFEHGVFTYFLLQAPYSGDANRDGYVTVTEAYDYTREKIDEQWNSEAYFVNRFAPHVSGGPVDYVLFTAE
ncbi:MAG: caspase family protein [Spirochaetales bacterium]|nr:caspase family protein [Spirochaetales bacterium]